MLRLSSLVAALLLVTACGEPSPELAEDSEDALSQESLSTWPVGKAEGITVWVSPVVSVAQVDGQTRWILVGRTSRNLAEAFSYIPDDPVGMARVTSPRKFEVQLANEEVRALAMGRQLLVRLTPATGEGSYTVAISGGPKFISQDGSSRIFLRTEVKPVLVGNAVLFRGRASTTSNMAGFDVLAGTTPPAVTQVSTRSWRFDWSQPELEAAASGFSGAVELRATSFGGEVSTRNGALAISIGQVLVTNGDAEAAFPMPACRSTVKSCLQTLSSADTEACGSAVAVLACGGAPAVQDIGADRFASDLRKELVSYYSAHGADIQAAGGDTLSQAQAAVDAANVTEVLENEDDPHSHDLSRVRVFRHGDVVFPGSDRVWFGAYDRQTGALFEIYEFN